MLSRAWPVAIVTWVLGRLASLARARPAREPRAIWGGPSSLVLSAALMMPDRLEVAAGRIASVPVSDRTVRVVAFRLKVRLAGPRASSLVLSAAVRMPALSTLATGRTASVPVSETTVTVVDVRVKLRLVTPPPPDGMPSSLVLSAAVMMPALSTLAVGRTASVPVSDWTVTVVEVRLKLRLVEPDPPPPPGVRPSSLVLSAAVMTPARLPVAAGRLASVPVSETTTMAVEVRVVERLVRPAAACRTARVLARQGKRKVVPSGAVAT